MDLILDTHIAIWVLDNDAKLPEEAKRLINNTDNNIYFSALSVMEICIKHKKNPEVMDWTGEEFYSDCLNAGFYTMPLKPKHAILMDDLKIKRGCTVNEDPFDRGLIAQAKQEKMVLLTHDKVMNNYDESCIMMV